MAKFVKTILFGAVAGILLGWALELGMDEKLILGAGAAVLLAVLSLTDAGIERSRRKKESIDSKERREEETGRFEEEKMLLTSIADCLKAWNETMKGLQEADAEHAAEKEKEREVLFEKKTAELEASLKKTADETAEGFGRLAAATQAQGEKQKADLEQLCIQLKAAVNTSADKISAQLEQSGVLLNQTLQTLSQVYERKTEESIQALKAAATELKESVKAAEAAERETAAAVAGLSENGIADRLLKLEKAASELAANEKQICEDYKELQNGYLREMIKLSESGRDTVRLLGDSYRYLNHLMNDR